MNLTKDLSETPHFLCFRLEAEKRRLLSPILPALAILALLLPGVARAQSGVWDGGGVDQLLSTAQNFDDDTALVSGAQALTFTGILNSGPVHDLGTGFIINGINFGNDGTVAINDQSFNLTANAVTDTFTLSGDITTTAIVGGGTPLEDIIAIDLMLDANRTIITKTDHNLDITGDISGAFTLFIGDGDATDDEALVTLSGTNTHSLTQINRGGNLRVESNAALGDELNLVRNAEVFLADGLTINLTGGINVQNNQNQKRIYLNDGGSSAEIASDINVNTSGTANNRRLELTTGSGDTLTISGVIQSGNTDANKIVRKLGAGTVILTAANSFDGQLQTNAGTLQLSHSLAAQNASVTMNNGAIVFDSSVVTNAFTFGALNGTSALALENNAGSPAPITLTIGGHADSRSHSGVISGAGGSIIINTNAGFSQALNGDNTYTGPTTVIGGRLDIGGSNVSAITVNTGATLGGEGSTSGGITFNAGSFLEINDNSGALSVTGGTLDTSAGNIGFVRDEIRSTGGGTFAILDHTGIALTSGGGGITGDFVTNFSRDSISDDGNILSYTQAATQTATWSGAAGNVWDIDNTASWDTNGQAENDSLFLSRDTAVFGDTGANASITLDNSNGDIFVQTATFDNTAGNDYVFDGAQLTTRQNITFNNGGNVTFNNDISSETDRDELRLTDLSTGDVIINGVISDGNGTTAIEHDGTGNLTLNGVNTHTGGNTVEAGATLIMGAERALGAISNTTTINSGATLQFGAFSINDYDAGSISIEGAGVDGLGAIVNTGDGNRDLGDDFDFTGDISLRDTGGGRIDLAGISVSGTDVNITVEGGTIRVDTNTSGLSIAGWTVNAGNLQNNNNGGFNGNSAVVTVNAGSFTGIGNRTIGNDLILNGGTFRADGNGNTTTFTGDITMNADANIRAEDNGANGDSLLILEGTLTGTGNISTSQTAQINLTTATFDATGYTGTWTQTAANTIQIDGNETINSLASSSAGSTFDLQSFTLTTGDTGSTTYDGAFVGTGGITKVGTGTFDLSDLSSYSGTTAVTGGRLNLTASGASAFASNIVQSSGAGIGIGGEGVTTGSLTLDSILFIDPSTPEELMVGDLDISGGVIVDFDGLTPAPGLIDVISYSGILTTNLGVAGGDLTLSSDAQAFVGARGAATFSDSSGMIQLDLGVGDKVWVGTTGGVWDKQNTGSGTANWSLSAGDNLFYDNDFVTFDDLVANGGSAVNTAVLLTENVSPQTVTFANAVDNYTVSPTGVEVLTVGSLLSANNAGTVDISADIAGGTTGLNIAGNGTGGLTISGNVVSTSGVNFTGSTPVTVSGTIGGAQVVTMNGSGVTTLSTTNTYSGGTLIQQGELLITESGAAGSGAVTLENLGNTPRFSIGDGTTVTNNLIISDTGGAKQLALENNPAGGNTATYAGTITINETGGNNFDIVANGGAAAGQVFTISGLITGTGPGEGSNALDLIGQGTINLTNAANNFLGNIRINAATTLRVTDDAALSSADFILTGSNAQVQIFDGITVDSNMTVDTAANDKRIILESGTGITGTYSGNIQVNETAAGRFDLRSNATGGNNDQTQILHVAGNITSIAGAGVTIDTDGVVRLTGDNNIANTSGGWGVQLTNRGSILRVGSDNALGGDGGATVLLTNRNTRLQIENGVVTNAANNLQVDNEASGIQDLSVLDEGGIEEATFSGNINVDELTDFDFFAGTNDTLKILGTVSSGAITRIDKTGAGTVVYGGTNTYSGETRVQDGTLQLGDNDSTTGSLNTAGTINLNNATAVLAFNRSNAVMQGTDFSTAAITGSGGISQVGTGTSTLNAANTYSGATSVLGGTLMINGDQSGATGVVTVGANATLGGTGTIGGNTTISAGANHLITNTSGMDSLADTQTFSGDLTYTGTASSPTTVSWNLIDTSMAAGSGWDLFDVNSGTLTFGTEANSISFQINDQDDLNQTPGSEWWRSDRTFTVWDYGTLTGGPFTGTDFDIFDIAYSGVNAGNGVSHAAFAFDDTGSAIVLNFTAVPEPSTFSLICLGLAGFGWFTRRRRNRRAAS
ncbi:MAG: autotransporter-associated beta strand repeat-containing protein [Verrucomicrobiales bacterium]|nr:autotransporter-associated beta strand repeat-containing protein [Verrucomicrobiales bacterium]